jgi:hypothetical protein
MLGGLAGGTAGAFVCAPTDATNPNINPHPNDALTTTRMHDLSCFQLRFSFQGLFGFYSFPARTTSVILFPMRLRQPISHRAPGVLGRRPRLSSLLHFLLAAWVAVPLPAQNAPQAQADESAPYTLHLYARLVELPTLIFFPRDQKPTLEAQQINIQLNSAQAFHPTSIRLEGNDPLSIAILLDVSGDQTNLVSAIQKDFYAWVSKSLRPQDHVSIFALNCNLIQTSSDVPANPAILQTGLNLALSSPLLQANSTQPSCRNSRQLRSPIVLVMRKLAQLPGRRILLVVTGGRDGKNQITWQQLASEAGVDSVTAFGLSTHGPLEFQGIEELYDFMRQSGGLLFTPTPAESPMALDRIISLLRARYILQFPMPRDKTPATYRVLVTVPKFNAIALPSSVNVPLPNPSLDHPSTDLPSEAPPPDSSPQPPDPQATTPPPQTPND